MKYNMRNFLLYIMILFGTISSVSAKGFFSNSYKSMGFTLQDHLKPKATLTTSAAGKPTPGQITMNTSSTPATKMLR